MNNSPDESLKVSLAAMKSVVSDYALRARQAEAMCNQLLNDKIPKEVFEQNIVNTVMKQIETRGLERSTQLLGVIQTTLLALSNIQKGITSLTPDELNHQLIEIIKALTVTANTQ